MAARARRDGAPSSSADPPATARDAVSGFAELRRADVGRAGGKGANLGELTAAGLPVPGGFVVGAAAYAAFRDGSGLRSRIAARLAAVEVEDTEELGRAADEIRAMVVGEPLPEWLADAIRQAYLGLADEDDPAVAVRSSATAEDTAAASADEAERPAV